MLKRLPATALLLALALAAPHALGQAKGKPDLLGQTDRPLRYTPDNADFVIEAAKEGDVGLFNRPLYGSNTPFRVDAGDLPEFMFYLPGRGGNLRLGFRVGQQSKWLNTAERITARYHEGTMLYEIHDALLGPGVLHITAVPLHETEGLSIKIEGTNTPDTTELLWAMAGSDGLAGSRRGDIGTENQPVGKFFAMKPASAQGNTITAAGAAFSIKGKSGTVAGLISGPADGLATASADAAAWENPNAMLASAGKNTNTPALVGHAPLTAAGRILQMQNQKANAPAMLPAALEKNFAAAVASRHAIATAIVVDTPDPFINASAPALCIAADACWDEATGTMMHGAVAWRSKLLGWRGPYALDEAGWHDRMTHQLTYWAAQQNTKDDLNITTAHADPKKNLATDDWVMLHTNGDMTTSHYDMNLAYIDYYMRHALWTGDTDLLKKTWPMLQRHLAWEQRCFRRVFTKDGEALPLYEAYAAIWASDNLQYDGGGTAHASALNYFDNMMAARIAKIIGEDGAPYEKEAALILKGMNRDLWVADKGIFGEFKDILGPQTVQDDPALWTFYHVVDSLAADPFQAYQMSRFVDTQIAHIPMHGPGVPADGGVILASSNWMPYMWSLNNFSLGENSATALADFQANRPDQGFATYKGNILDGMFMGICPGDCHMSSQFDVYRGESQRDFADPTAMTLRALVEGLFGIKPDLLAGTLTLKPGFPAAWDHASIQQKDVSFSFKRSGEKGLTDTYTIKPNFDKAVALTLLLPARTDAIARLLINGQPAEWKPVYSAVGTPQVEIEAPSAPTWNTSVEITWAGNPIVPSPKLQTVAMMSDTQIHISNGQVTRIVDPQKILENSVTPLPASEWVGSISVETSPGFHTFFANVTQGDISWWMPVDVEIVSALDVIASKNQDEKGLRFSLRNSISEALDRQAIYAGKAVQLQAAAHGGMSPEMFIPAEGLLPGTNRIIIDLSDTAGKKGASVRQNLTNWHIPLPANAKLETVDCSAAFNADITSIFKTDYLSPRSPYVSLSIPKQGLGGWADNAKTATIDDTGLRNAARATGQILGPQKIPFKTPATGKNIAFTSFWDNHPKEITVPLTGNARHIYLLMAGTTNPMRSGIQNGQVIVTYADGTTSTLALDNPSTWWPIDEDYLVDDFAFSLRGAAPPPRLDLRTGQTRILDATNVEGRGGNIPGGAALILNMPLENRPLKSLTIRPSTYEVIIGLMGATLVR